MKCLEVEDLQVFFPTDDGLVKAVNGVSFSIDEGDALCLVGESGCGKSVIGTSILRLLPANALIRGRILFYGENLLTLPNEKMQRLRGKEIGMIFEQPASCLNPVLPVGIQIAEGIMAHTNCTKRDAMREAVELMERLAIPSARERSRQYPHEFSIGMQQRIMIAIAVACRPKLLIADEPTTALDVTIQAQIVGLLKELVRTYRMTLLLITHDLSVSLELSRHVAVMYAGEFMETGPAEKIFHAPVHPYTQALLGSMSGHGLNPIPGFVPEFTHLPEGCAFHPRCSGSTSICLAVHPEMSDCARCHHV